jgi:hypothetical protein
MMGKTLQNRKNLLRALLEHESPSVLEVLANDVFHGVVTRGEGYVPKAQPLGFSKVILLEYKGFSLRMHHWSSTTRMVQSPELLVHDHLFDFCSYVLRGSLTNIEYTVDADRGVDPAYRLFRVSYDSGGSVLVPEGPGVAIEEIKRTSHLQGSFYSLVSTVYHESYVAPNKSTVTMIATSKAQPKDAHVVGPYCISKSLRHTREDLDKSHLLGELSELV